MACSAALARACRFSSCLPYPNWALANHVTSRERSRFHWIETQRRTIASRCPPRVQVDARLSTIEETERAKTRILQRAAG